MPLPEVVSPICSETHLQWQKSLNLCKQSILIFCCITMKTLPLTSNLFFLRCYQNPSILYYISIRLNNSILFGLSLQVMFPESMFAHISIYSSHAFTTFCSTNKEPRKTCVQCILDNNEFLHVKRI